VWDDGRRAEESIRPKQRTSVDRRRRRRRRLTPTPSISRPCRSVGDVVASAAAAAAAITTKEKSARAFSTKNWSHATPSDRRAAQKVVDRSYTSFYFSTTHDRVEHLK